MNVYKVSQLFLLVVTLRKIDRETLLQKVFLLMHLVLISFALFLAKEGKKKRGARLSC